jgi:hypothetical protein
LRERERERERERVEHWFNAHSTLEKGEKKYYFKRKSEIEKR